MSWLSSFFSAAHRPLQERLAILIAAAVTAAVATTGVAAYALTLLTVYDQLDNELVEVASIEAAMPGVLARVRSLLSGEEPGR